jgi:hypothetical protein
MAKPYRGPSLSAVCLGTVWISILLGLFGTMMAGYAQLWGVPGLAFGMALLPVSAPAYPIIAWYTGNGFPWLWTVGLAVAVVLGNVLLRD